MTQEEILRQGKLIEIGNLTVFELKVFHFLSDRGVTIQIHDVPDLNDNANSVTEKINDILNFSVENEPKIINEIWNHYNSLTDNGTIGEYHFKNQDEAYSSVKLSCISTDIYPDNIDYFNIEYKCPWEEEHGIKFVIVDGKIDSIE